MTSGTVILAGEFGRKLTAAELDRFVTVSVNEIRGLTADQIRNWIEIGNALARLKERAGHGRFKSLFPASKAEYADPEKLPFGYDVGKRLMAVARNEALSKSDHVHFLPSDYQSLYELSRLEPPVLEAAIEAGDVTPTTSRDDIKTLVSGKRPVKATTNKAKSTKRASKPKRYDREAIHRQHVSQFSEWLRGDAQRTLGEYGVRVVDAADTKTLDRIEARIRERRAQLAESQELRKRAMKTA